MFNHKFNMHPNFLVLQEDGHPNGEYSNVGSPQTVFSQMTLVTKANFRKLFFGRK